MTKSSTLSPQVEAFIEMYLEVLTAKDSYYTYTVEYGRKFAKVISLSGGNSGTNRSVHSFVEIANGNVIKAATWKAPQKNSDGTFSVRYNLLDAASREEMFRVLDPHGGYLYAK